MHHHKFCSHMGPTQNISFGPPHAQSYIYIILLLRAAPRRCVWAVWSVKNNVRGICSFLFSNDDQVQSCQYDTKNYLISIKLLIFLISFAKLIEECDMFFKTIKLIALSSLRVGCCVRSHRLIMWNSGTNINEYTIEHSRIIWHVNCCAYCSEPLVDQYLIEHPLNMIFLSLPLPVKIGVNVLTRETARGLSTWKILVFGQIVVVEKKIVYYCLRVLFFFEYESKIH